MILLGTLPLCSVARSSLVRAQVRTALLSYSRAVAFMSPLATLEAVVPSDRR